MMLGSLLGCPLCCLADAGHCCLSLCSILRVQGTTGLGICKSRSVFFHVIKKKNSTTGAISHSLYLFIFASEAAVYSTGFSRLNVFSAYLIRSWNRVMKFTGLCSLHLKYKWAKHSFCFTPCQIRVLF